MATPDTAQEFISDAKEDGYILQNSVEFEGNISWPINSDLRSTRMMLRKRCAYCRGQGSVSGSEGPSAPLEPCPVCNQRGYNLVPGDAALCGCCQGSGRVPAGGGAWRPCPDCNGIGYKW